jgi:ferredoxin
MGRKRDYRPLTRFTEKMPAISGNTVNGLGEVEERRPSPFFWHPPERQTHGELQAEVLAFQSQSEAMRTWFSPNPPGGRGPDTVPRASEQVTKSAQDWTDEIKAFALANESDLAGIATLDPMWVYEGYEIAEPTVVMVAVEMEYAELAEAPPSIENPRAAVVVAKEYNRAARACRKLRNYILERGYAARAYQGPYATALNMLPAAIAAGLGELGKHGSLINSTYGSSFRLSAVSTDMPLLPDQPEIFGADDYCTRCQACTNVCPPAAISNEKQLVRGVEKWYVDFDKCIPYFGETLGCGLCLAQCPWSRPGNAQRLIERSGRRREFSEADE